ncbi:unnamed protein product [Ectocarpus sp. CCAP 1310/34]|nr:unnamed protein product [Ectocarpus sp. CCAP 1310/34]
MMNTLFGEMLQFALVLGTIMMGFTVWLAVFKAMLGEVSVFSENYEDSVHRDVARVLLVVYLAVVAVMLLNLFIAVLSSVVVILHVFALPFVLAWFWVRSGLGLAALTTLAAALCGGNGGEDGSGKRVPRRPSAAGSGGGPTAGSPSLENPTTPDGLAQRQDEQDQTVTVEEIIRARDHLDEAGRGRGEAVLALLKSVNADLKDQIAELERSVARSVESLRVGSEASVASIVEAEVAKAVEESRGPSPRGALSPAAGAPRVDKPGS